MDPTLPEPPFLDQPPSDAGPSPPENPPPPVLPQISPSPGHSWHLRLTIPLLGIAVVLLLLPLYSLAGKIIKAPEQIVPQHLTDIEPSPTPQVLKATPSQTAITFPQDINWVQTATASYNLITDTTSLTAFVLPGTTYTAAFSYATADQLAQADPLKSFQTKVADHFSQLSPDGHIGAQTIIDRQFYPPKADSPYGSVAGIILTSPDTFQLVSWAYQSSWSTLAHDNTPPTCPCTITYFVFISDSLPSNQVTVLPTPTVTVMAP